MQTLRNRLCAANNSDFEPSVDYALECDTETKLNKGCKSGYLLNSLQFAQDNGYVEKKCYDKVTDGKGGCPTE